MTFPESIYETYEIERPIGEGGGGVVYLGYHKRLEKKVVLKKIKGSISDYSNYRAEVDALKLLKHSYLPQVIDFIESPEGIFTVMDYIEGESLQAKIDKGYTFSEKEIKKYSEQLCQALIYLHSQKPPLIHGDIKPDNIMVTNEGNICLIDFNISGFLNGNRFETVGHTPGFSSPEQRAAFMHAMNQNKKAGQQSSSINMADNYGIGSEDETVLITEKSQDYSYDKETEYLDNRKQDDIGDARIKKWSSNNSETGKTNNVSVDTRSDIYSLGATLYALFGGDVHVIGERKLKFSERVSDGMRIIISKAVEINPGHRYQSASDVLRALQRVEKMSAKYRTLIWKQRLKIFVYTVLLAMSVVLVVLGQRRMNREFDEKYEVYVTELKDVVNKQGEKEDVDKAFEEATKLYDDRLEPYFYKAYYYYNLGEKEKFISLVEDIEKKVLDGDDETFSRLWYLMADTKFDEKVYTEAEKYYYRSIVLDPENASLYRDYAISLIYNGKLQKAEGVLIEATDKGMHQADIFMVRGELAKIQNNTAEAIECFSKVIEVSSNEQQSLRAYVGLSKCCMDDGSEEMLKKGTEILEQGIKNLIVTNRLLLYEQLGALYIKLGEMNNESAQFAKAIKIYEEIVNMSWANNVTYSNLVVLNQRVININEAQKWAEKMCDRYPDDYVSYMRRALVELEIQNGKSEDERAFEVFKEYYNKAVGLYKKAEENGSIDSEMMLLKNAYNQLKNGGWIE